MMIWDKVQSACRVLAVVCVPALMIAACSGESEPTAAGDIGATLDGFSVEMADDGSIEQVTSLAPSAEPQTAEEAHDAEVVTKAGCVHIRFCDAPGSDQVVCDTNDRPCSREARLAECFDDADAVCGNWTRMRFDPPI